MQLSNDADMFWRSREGPLFIPHMTTTHLINTIGMLDRWGKHNTKPYRNMVRELDTRGTEHATRDEDIERLLVESIQIAHRRRTPTVSNG
jgi:membrane-bound lytic murein transglycosylase B